MSFTLGIRREDKNRWERRTPLIPQHIKELNKKHGIGTIVQPSPIRIFSDEEYEQVGAKVQDDMISPPIVFAIKEIPIDFFEPGKTYVFFSHTIKGQRHNMPMLKRMMDLKCTLIDYEKIVDKHGRRLVFFGRFAGIAGMIDTLWAFGQRLKWKNIDTPFYKIRRTINYDGLEEIKEHLSKIRKIMETRGLPNSIIPLICGFAGYGNVSKGAQEIMDYLPVKEIPLEEIKQVYETPSSKYIYKIVFKEKDMVEPVSLKDRFDLQDYYDHPERYKSVFERYIPYLSILMNCIYWDKRYPRLVTKEYIKDSFAKSKKLHLQVIGDISCDIYGAIEFTVKATSPDNPVFVYNPNNDDIRDGYKGDGIVVMAVDNLPCELPKESSKAFSDSLWRFVPAITNANFNVDFEKLKLPFEIKNAVILYNGELTPNYRYISNYL